MKASEFLALVVICAVVGAALVVTLPGCPAPSDTPAPRPAPAPIVPIPVPVPVPNPCPEPLGAAIRQASAEGKRVLVICSGKGCSACALFHATLSHRRVQEHIRAYVVLHVDCGQYPAVAARLHVTAIPAYCLLSSNGVVIVSGSGYRTPEGFIHWLDAARE